MDRFAHFNDTVSLAHAVTTALVYHSALTTGLNADAEECAKKATELCIASGKEVNKLMAAFKEPTKHISEQP